MLSTCAHPLRLLSWSKCPSSRYSTMVNRHKNVSRFILVAQRRRSLAKSSSNLDSEFNWEEMPQGSKEIQAAVQAAQLLLRQGDAERAKDTLKTAISMITQQYGSNVEHLGILHTQLYLLCFIEGQYQEALQQAQDSYRCTVAAMGEDSGEAVLLGLRVGIASLAAGDPEGAEPFLMAAGAVLEEQMNMMRQELAQLMQQGIQPEQGDMLTITNLMAAGGESKVYAALCLMRLSPPDTWGENVELQDMLMTGVQELAMVMQYYNDIVQCVIREHNRLVKDSSGAASLRLAKQHEELVQAFQQPPPSPIMN